MPSTSLERRREVLRNWYARHPEAKDQIGERKRRYVARNRAIVAEALAERCPCGSTNEGHLLRRKIIVDRVARRPSSAAKVRAAIEECDGT